MKNETQKITRYEADLASEVAQNIVSDIRL